MAWPDNHENDIREHGKKLLKLMNDDYYEAIKQGMSESEALEEARYGLNNYEWLCVIWASNAVPDAIGCDDVIAAVNASIEWGF